MIIRKNAADSSHRLTCQVEIYLVFKKKKRRLGYDGLFAFVSVVHISAFSSCEFERRQNVTPVTIYHLRNNLIKLFLTQSFN